MEKQVQAGGVTWRDITGFECLYKISEYGNVYSYITRKELKHFINIGGYHIVVLSNSGKTLKTSIHRLVCINFIKNPENKPQVNHKDGNKSNNHYSNLEWCTPLENNIHAYATGLKVLPKGAEDKKISANNSIQFRRYICQRMGWSKGSAKVGRFQTV